MNDTASLEIRVLSDQVEQANRRLDNLEKKGSRAERATDGLTGAFSRLAGPLLAAVSATAALSKLVDVSREFDKLNSGLITATGSAENAKVAFEAIQDFATNTPYDLAQVADSFTKLVNYGLTPSERALTSYGNTASALGKDLNQMIEAVADAATGEFERLKEFGIRASAEGDRVKFTFRGITTEVGKNTQEIEQYLIALGENNFADAMANRMDTLDGALSNLSDEWDKLFLNISQAGAGVGDVIEDSVRLAIDALAELNDMLASGELEGYLTAIAGKFDGWGEDIQETIRILTQFYKDNLSQFEDEGASTVRFLIDAFKNFPENVRAFIQIMVTEVAAGLDRAKAYAGAFKDSIKAIFNDDTVAGVGARLEQRLQNINAARQESLQDIFDEREAALSSFDRQIAAAKKLREEYDKNQAARRAQAGDRLAGFRQSGGGEGASGSVDKAAAAAAKKRQDEFQRLVESLRTEEEAIRASYEKRKQIIEQNTAAGSGQRADLMARLDSEYAEELAKLQEAKGRELEEIRRSLLTEEESIRESYERRMKIVEENTAAGSAQREELMAKLQTEYDGQLKQLEDAKQRERDSLYNGLLTEEEMIRQSYERRKQQILESTAVTETERLELMKRLEEQYSNELAAMETKRMQTQLSNAAALFNGLAGLAKAYGGEQSKAYRALFAISKAFSITQAAMSIATGLAKAQELGWPANLAAMAQIAAQGASIMSQINGSNFSGAYDQGGVIPAGKIGLVGEYGPEFVAGPANVTSREKTAQMLENVGKGGGQQAPAPQTNLRIINAFDTGVIGDYLGSDDGEQAIMNVVQRNATTIRSMVTGG
jgi:hypothetical protein